MLLHESLFSGKVNGAGRGRSEHESQEKALIHSRMILSCPSSQPAEQSSSTQGERHLHALFLSLSLPIVPQEVEGRLD